MSTVSSSIRDYHAASWDEGVIYELGAPGRRGVVPPQSWAPQSGDSLFPQSLRKLTPAEVAALPPGDRP